MRKLLLQALPGQLVNTNTYISKQIHRWKRLRHLWTHIVLKATSGLQHSPHHSAPVSVELETSNTEERLLRQSDATNSRVFRRQSWVLNSKHSNQWIRGQNVDKYECFFLLWNSLFLAVYQSADLSNADTMMGQWSHLLIQFLIFPSHVQHKKDEVCQIQNSIFVQYIFF